MKRYEVLKVVVILQAVCMIALTGMVLVKVWPESNTKGDERNDKLDPPRHQEGGKDPHSDGDTWADPERGAEVVATVNGQSITRAQLSEQLYKQYGNNMLRVMMVRLAIDVEVEATKIEVSEEELNRELATTLEGYDSEERFFIVMKEHLGLTKKQVMDEMRYRLLMEKIATRNIPIADDDVERYITSNPEQFEPNLQLHLQWIVTGTKTQAESILDKLQQGEEFADLARNYSQDEFTAEDGGDLGMIEADDPFYNKQMLDTAGEMSIGEIEGPIEVEQGFAIIQLVGRKMNSGLSGTHLFNAVRKKLALEQARPLPELEDELLERYGAVILK
ncbi:peptidylprolyl isomerase [Paenibacillus sp. GSMTC-2017]|uniref:peptidylprolyl isomerase n=1 Tax=Paenibacillus sp. GSMTC-2017 TaxID=2794350 RepID=UPI0018D62EDE|nr:peptidylprolyl isomerase [Paenibacillus sp. GSMTC-2017]MBH5320678.1 peptidylprolyl isomerase [Paenibacillus sp. GSMTC-2017]